MTPLRACQPTGNRAISLLHKPMDEHRTKSRVSTTCNFAAVPKYDFLFITNNSAANEKTALKQAYFYQSNEETIIVKNLNFRLAWPALFVIGFVAAYDAGAQTTAAAPSVE